jgi:hypothetical protein
MSAEPANQYQHRRISSIFIEPVQILCEFTYSQSELRISPSYHRYNQDLIDELMRDFSYFSHLLSLPTVDDSQLNYLIIAQNNIISSMYSVTESYNVLHEDKHLYDMIMDEIATAYNNLTAYLERNMELLQNYVDHAFMLDADRRRLVDLYDRLFFTFDNEISSILSEFQSTCLVD